MAFGVFQQFNPYKPSGGGGPPSFVRAEGATSTKGADVNVIFPTPPANGHLLLAIVDFNDGDLSVPTGFTQIATGATGQRCYYKVCGASEPTSYTWGGNGSGAKSDQASVTMAEISGQNASPIDASAVSASSATSPSVTTTAANDLVFTLGSSFSSSSDYTTPPTGYTLPANGRNETDDGTEYSVTALAYKTVAATGSTSPGAWNAGSGRIYTVAIK